MKRFYPFFTVSTVFIVIFALSSCAARIEGALAADGSAVLSVNMSLENRMASLIRLLSDAGGQTGVPVLDGPAIARSMADAPGIASVSFRNTSSTAIEGQVRISRINDFLSPANGRGFITFEQTTSGGRFEVNINRQTSPAIIELLSSEISDYLNALMAPIASGEVMTRSEYLEIVSTFYNVGISDEIAFSRIRATIDFPGTITSIRGGTFSGRRANFDISLLDLLVLETPMIFEVRW
ncbi:MAG: hypothetical protein FWD24_01395 [Treponema sp.]|nr:hypothetical protein [Treponema sp.]